MNGYKYEYVCSIRNDRMLLVHVLITTNYIIEDNVHLLPMQVAQVSFIVLQASLNPSNTGATKSHENFKLYVLQLKKELMGL